MQSLPYFLAMKAKVAIPVPIEQSSISIPFMTHLFPILNQTITLSASLCGSIDVLLGTYSSLHARLRVLILIENRHQALSLTPDFFLSRIDSGVTSTSSSSLI